AGRLAVPAEQAVDRQPGLRPAVERRLDPPPVGGARDGVRAELGPVDVQQRAAAVVDRLDVLRPDPGRQLVLRVRLDRHVEVPARVGPGLAPQHQRVLAGAGDGGRQVLGRLAVV
ncbi:MAG: hypothetical protein AVDCRST_MAG64-1082, partial [uncultured Phycisphaerae bacterium]